MKLHDRNKISYYASLAIFFGALELFIPKPIPFFRLGIANIPIILSLPLPFYDFLSIALLKGIGNSYVSGNLFSFFGIISISQSLLSAIAMYGVKKAFKRHISHYGISMIGAIVSTLIQVFLASIYLGYAITSILPIMLSLSLISSLLVAFISYRLQLPNNPPNITIESTERKNSIVSISTLIISSFSIVITRTTILSLIAFIFALTLQYLSGRRIKLVPYIIVIALIVFSSMFTPSGEVIISFGKLALTKDALDIALAKGLRLSAGIALSQGYSQIIKAGNGIIGKTLLYFTALIASFRQTEGNSIIERAKKVLLLESLNTKLQKRKEISNKLLYLYSAIFISIAIISRLYF